MKIKIDKSFDRDVSKIKDKNILRKLRAFISAVDKVNDITGVSHVKKLQGYHSFYRVKIGDYRLGLELTPDNMIIFTRFLHRKDVYRYFPRRK